MADKWSSDRVLKCALMKNVAVDFYVYICICSFGFTRLVSYYLFQMNFVSVEKFNVFFFFFESTYESIHLWKMKGRERIECGKIIVSERIWELNF